MRTKRLRFWQLQNEKSNLFSFIQPIVRRCLCFYLLAASLVVRFTDAFSRYLNGSNENRSNLKWSLFHLSRRSVFSARGCHFLSIHFAERGREKALLSPPLELASHPTYTLQHENH